jgi:hypothetical protein
VSYYVTNLLLRDDFEGSVDPKISGSSAQFDLYMYQLVYMCMPEGGITLLKTVVIELEICNAERRAMGA